MIGQRPQVGRDFGPEDDRPGATPVVILGHNIWTNRYNSDPAAIGRTIRINGVPSTVVGVMAAGFQFPMSADLWQPLAQMPGVMDQKRDARMLSVFGRLAQGFAMDTARSDLNVITERLTRTYPDTNTDVQATVMPYDQRYIGPQVKLVFVALMGAVAFVLLIGCANVANLLLTRAAHRSSEISVRVAIGANRWRIVRQLLAESILIALCSGLLGFVLSLLGVWLFEITAGRQPGKPYWLQFTMDMRVFAFLAGISLGTGLLFGLAPALHVSKTNVMAALKEGGRTHGSGVRVRRGFIWCGRVFCCSTDPGDRHPPGYGRTTPAGRLVCPSQGSSAS